MGKSVSHFEHHWALLLSLVRSQLCCSKSRMNNPQNSTCFDPEEWILLRLCLEKCYSQVYRVGTFLWIRKFSVPPVALCTTSSVRETFALVYYYLIFQQNLTPNWLRIFVHPDSKLFGVYLGKNCKLALFLLFHMEKKQPHWWSEFRFPLDCLQISDNFKHFILWLKQAIIKK